MRCAHKCHADVSASGPSRNVHTRQHTPLEKCAQEISFVFVESFIGTASDSAKWSTIFKMVKKGVKIVEMIKNGQNGQKC